LDLDLDGRSDIYSLGCVMFETLTGTPPLLARTAFETMNKHLTQMPEKLSQVRPDLSWPSRLEVVIEKCLMKDPNDRYKTATSLEDELVNLSSGKSEAVRVTGIAGIPSAENSHHFGLAVEPKLADDKEAIPGSLKENEPPNEREINPIQLEKVKAEQLATEQNIDLVTARMAAMMVITAIFSVILMTIPHPFWLNYLVGFVLAFGLVVLIGYESMLFYGSVRNAVKTYFRIRKVSTPELIKEDKLLNRTISVSIRSRKLTWTRATIVVMVTFVVAMFFLFTQMSPMMRLLHLAFWQKMLVTFSAIFALGVLILAYTLILEIKEDRAQR
jgi:serine/threonine protein kinase